jgi:hypothetical protein
MELIQRQKINELLTEISEATREQLKERTFMRLKNHCEMRSKAKAKMHKVLGRLQSRIDCEGLADAWKTVHLETLRRQFVEGQEIRRLVSCFHKLKDYAQTKGERALFTKDVEQLYETQLMQKALSRLKNYRLHRRTQKHLKQEAEYFWVQHSGTRQVQQFMYQLAE